MLLWLYWLSPILFYISYVHSQLDAIPIALTLTALHLLFKERWLWSFVLLAAAIATKLHILVVVPFFIVYLWRQQKPISTIITALCIIGGIVVSVIGIQFLKESYRTIVLFNPEQGKIFNSTLTIGDGVIYVVPAAFLLLVLHSLTFTRFNRDTFVMFLGFCFSILILGITPMPGWYFWVIPFLTYFYVKYERFSKIHFFALTGAYFFYFATTPQSDVFLVFSSIAPTVALLGSPYQLLEQMDINATLVNNIALTALQATLLINIIWLYKRGVEDSKRRKLYNMPYLIGIAGDSGSGKSTLATLLTNIFGASNLALVAGDAMHKWERGNDMWQKFTHLNPNANHLHDDIEHVLRLQNGDTTYRRHYDHDTGTFTNPEKLDSKKVVVFEGLHSLYLTYMQRVLDLKIFIAPEEQLRIHWKLQRDMRDRGYTREKVLQQIQTREADSKRYIATQAEHADIVFSLKSETDLAPILGSDTIIETYLEITCDNTVNVARFVNAIDTHISVEHHLDDSSHVIRVSGGIDRDVIDTVSLLLVPELYDILISEPEWAENYNGIMQLFIIFYMFETLRPQHYDRSH
jgi:uridine kinase